MVLHVTGPADYVPHHLKINNLNLKRMKIQLLGNSFPCGLCAAPFKNKQSKFKKNQDTIIEELISLFTEHYSTKPRFCLGAL